MCVCVVWGSFGPPEAKVLVLVGRVLREMSPPQLPPFSVVSARLWVCWWCKSAALGAAWLNVTVDPLRFVFGSSAGEQ